MMPVGVRQFFQPRAHHGTTLMLKILGPSQGRFCDGVSRRNFLQLGALAAGGLSLPQLLQAEAQSGVRNSNKAIIMVFLPGGPSHQDMFDIKEDAPKEIRGEFKSIATKVPGVRICEHMPKLAANWDKFAAIRSLVGKADDHSSFHCMTGRSQFKPQPSGVGRRSVRWSRRCRVRRRSVCRPAWAATARRRALASSARAADRSFPAAPVPAICRSTA